jgi:DNA (cytosine-5)-methyltransferase 1
VKALDLCSGAAGAWALGLHRAGITTVAACEAVAWRRDLYALNNPGVKLYDDLRSLTGARLRADGVTAVDLVAGSPPCGEYSSVGSGGGLDADDLFLHAVRIVDEVRPRWFAAENSAFIKTRGYDRIADALEALGYTCWPFVVEARDLGARHGRPRVIILAADLSRPQGRPPRLTRPDRHVGGAPDWSAGRFARYDLPNLGPAGAQRLGRHLREFIGVSSGVAEQCREAYGDSLLPQLAEAVGRAIIAVEQAGVL